MKRTELTAEELEQVTGGWGGGRFSPDDEMILTSARQAIPTYEDNDNDDDIILQDASAAGITGVVTNPKSNDRNFILG